jgi:hypothetical protein
MSEFFDYSPHNGMRYDTEDGDNDDDLIIHSSQDVAPLLDRMQREQSKGENKQAHMRHYCSIPTVVEVELRAKGINIYNKHQTKELLREINTNYPHLKATRMHHEI